MHELEYVYDVNSYSSAPSGMSWKILGIFKTTKQKGEAGLGLVQQNSRVLGQVCNEYEAQIS